MRLPILSGALALALAASTTLFAAGAAFAEDLNMWVQIDARRLIQARAISITS